MPVCINKSSVEYQSLKLKAGIPEFMLEAVSRKFLDKYNRFPHLDELPNANSESYLRESLKVGKDNGAKIQSILDTTGKETIEEATIAINNLYRDLETTITPINKEALVDIVHRPTTNNFDNWTEEDHILARAPRDSNGNLLAPNGKISNLTEQQYVLVRTKAFKNWFGNWEIVNTFNIDNVDTTDIDIIQDDKKWRKREDGKHLDENGNWKSNKVLRFYLKGQHEKGYFELVKDEEFGQYSVHFLTFNGKEGDFKFKESTKEDRAKMYKALLEALPDGAIISTWGTLSEGGFYGVDKIGRLGNMKKIGERDVFHKEREGNFKVSIYQKGKAVSKVVDENGEPLVVYHSSNRYFTEFSHNYGSENTNARDSKELFFFMTDKEGSNWYSWMGNSRDERHSGLNIDSYINSYIENANLLYEEYFDYDSLFRIYDNGVILYYPSQLSVPQVIDFNDPNIQYTLNSNLIEDIKSYIENNISDKEFADLNNALKYKEDLRNSYDESAGVYIDSDPTLVEKIKHLFNRGFFLNIKNIEDASDVKRKNNVKSSLIKYVEHKDKDGFVIKDTIDSATQRGLTDVYAVRNPNQIKSATDNSGLFSNLNNNVYDDVPNSYLILNNALLKLATLYGITFNEVTDAELNSERWKDLMPDNRLVNAFVYDGQIYINLDRADIDAPIHEMLHMLVGSLRFTNPNFYQELVDSVEKFPNYEKLLMNHEGRTRNDVNEEILISEFARHLSGMPSVISKLDDRVKYEVLYNIKRMLDTVLMGQDSVKTISDERLFNLSLKEIAAEVNSAVMVNDFKGTFNVEGSELHRRLNNTKKDLYKKGILEEQCE